MIKLKKGRFLSRLEFSLDRFLIDSAVFLIQWLSIFSLFRIFTYLCSRPPIWGLSQILICSVAHDFTGFVLIWLPWAILQIMFQRSTAARYLSLVILILASVAGFFNAVFIAWAHGPLDHTFFTYLLDLGSFTASASEIILPWYAIVLFGIVLICLLATGWRYVYLSRKNIFKFDRRWTAIFCGVIAILALISLGINDRSRRERPDKHGEAIAKNFFSHEADFVIERRIFLSKVSSYGNRGEDSIAADIRRKLVHDEGLYKYLNDSYPLMKYNLSFSKPGKRKGIWDRSRNIRPHIVILFMESFRAKDIGAYGSSKGLTPAFDRLSENGWLWENFYANGMQTPRGALAALTSLYPYLGPSIQRSTPDFPLRGLGSILKEYGYKTEFYHNGLLEFDKKVPFFSNLGFDTILGMKQLDPNHEFGRYGWGFPDIAFVKILAEKLNTYKSESPLLLTIFTVTHHHPWEIPDPSLKVVEEEKLDDYSRFQNSMHYSDHALGVFFKSLKKDVLDRSIFLITSDTAQPMGEHHNNFGLVRYLYEENLRIPLLIYAPGYIKEEQRFSETASQVDIMPTVLDMLNIKCSNHAIGRSLLSLDDGSFAHFSNPYFKRWAGIRLGRYKYIYQFADEEELLFDLESDPEERDNIIGQYTGLARTLREMTLERIKSTHYLVKEKRIWPRLNEED